MTKSTTLPNPPAIPRALLDLLLPLDARESVSGDLLEEYREARLPAFGRVRADLWYWRQVAGIWLRSYRWFVAPVVLLLVAHDIFNVFRDPSGASYLDGLPNLVRLPLSPIVAVCVFALAAVYGSWRTRRWAGGFAAAIAMSVVVWAFMALWWNATLYPFAQVQQASPYWIQAWQWSTHRAYPSSIFGFNPDTPDASFLRWIFWDNVGALFFLGISMLAMSIVCGSIGGTLGAIAARWRPAVNRKP